jgi:protein gp37
MSDNSKIEWTDATWNPVRGCTKISPGCAHCYAKTFSERFRGVPGHPFEQGFDLRLVPEKLGDPLRWESPRRIFVNSMSDLFHPKVPDEYIEKVARVMVAASWHTYQVLTKRADRLHDLLKGKLNFATKQNHIWWGVSVENKQHGLPRIELLRNSPAQVRFLSVEPLLESLGGSSLAAKAVRVQDRWIANGCAIFATNAAKQKLHFSSNNGGASARKKPADTSTEKLTANFPSWNMLKNFRNQIPLASRL